LKRKSKNPKICPFPHKHHFPRSWQLSNKQNKKSSFYNFPNLGQTDNTIFNKHFHVNLPKMPPIKVTTKWYNGFFYLLQFQIKIKKINSCSESWGIGSRENENKWFQLTFRFKWISRISVVDFPMNDIDIKAYDLHDIDVNLAWFFTVFLFVCWGWLGKL
jgi:hypothetical protein